MVKLKGQQQLEQLLQRTQEDMPYLKWFAKYCVRLYLIELVLVSFIVLIWSSVTHGSSGQWNHVVGDFLFYWMTVFYGFTWFLFWDGMGWGAIGIIPFYGISFLLIPFNLFLAYLKLNRDPSQVFGNRKSHLEI